MYVRVLNRPLVHYGIQDMLTSLDTGFQTRLTMNTNLKIALSAIALAAIVAAPAVAKSRTQHTGQSPTYSNNNVVQDGRVVGTDPDAFVRHEIQRDHDYYHAD